MAEDGTSNNVRHVPSAVEEGGLESTGVAEMLTPGECRRTASGSDREKEEDCCRTAATAAEGAAGGGGGGCVDFAVVDDGLMACIILVYRFSRCNCARCCNVCCSAGKVTPERTTRSLTRGSAAAFFTGEIIMEGAVTTAFEDEAST